jgi:NAD(P)H-hydrate epimerase
MRAVDKDVIASGTSGKTLMGRAAQGLAEEIVFLTDGRPRPVTILTGPGNNGGDGFGLAVQLRRIGWPVEIWSAVPETAIRGDAAFFYAEAKHLGIPLRWLPEAADWCQADVHLMPGTLLVDALLGTGVSGEPRDALAAAVRFLRKRRHSQPVIAVDVPSGLNADVGGAYNPDCCVIADFTLTLGGMKIGYEVDSSAGWAGSISVVDLEVDHEVLEKHACSEWHVMGVREVRKLIPCPVPETHKGTRGHVLVIGGSVGMSGSVSMAAKAALHTGSGLASVFTPSTVATAVDVSVPEIMVHSARVGQFGSLTNQHIPLAGINGVLVGPGMRVDYDTRDLVERVFLDCKVPLVLDADALPHLKGFPEWSMTRNIPRYLTPHPGEMGRMLVMTSSEVQKDRVGAVQRAHQESRQANVVLKGSRSRVVTSAGRSWLNVNGNPGMATGGSGDVLAGMVVSLAAQGVYPELVLPLAVYLHGKAGDLAMMRKGQSGMTASDIAEAIPAVLKYVQGR